MRFNLSINLFFSIFISIALISCSKSSRIDEKKFVKVYAEMIFMQDTSSYSPSVIKNKILKKFDVKEFEYAIRMVNKKASIFFTSTLSGDGIDNWCAYLTALRASS